MTLEGGKRATGFAPWLVGGLILLIITVIVFRSLNSPSKPVRPIETTVHDPKAVADAVYHPPSDQGFVGSEACVECHREIAEAYKSHPMSRSIARIHPDTTELQVIPAATRVDGKTRSFQVEWKDGRMVHHERMYDSDGKPIYDQAVAMDYVVGSGKRAKAYLYQEDHVLFMSPLNWYSQSGKWDLAPGYVADDPRRFDRRVTDECLSCHAGRVAPVGRELNSYQTSAFHEMAIGCESCHGAGQAHVTIRASGKSVAAGGDPIINPSRLDASRRESICNSCHLQAAVRLPRPGRSDLDFRPGDNLDDIWTVLDIKRPITADGRTHSVNHVQQMRESRCFTESAGRFGCTSCHDPHRAPTEDQRLSFYREKCLACHKESTCTESSARRQQEMDNCATCHMPARHSSNISHVTQTDHRLIRKKESSLAEANAEDSDTLSFFDNQNSRLDPLERERAMGLGAWVRLTKTGRPPPRQLGQFLNQVLEKTPEDGLLLTALGTMAQSGNRLDLARDYFEAARRIPAAEEAATAGLLDIYYASSDWPSALKCADRLIEINPRDAKAFTLKADILAHLERMSEGIDAAHRALELNPTLIQLRQWLVKAYRTQNRDQEAAEEEKVIQRMETARLPERS